VCSYTSTPQYAFMVNKKAQGQLYLLPLSGILITVRDVLKYFLTCTYTKQVSAGGNAEVSCSNLDWTPLTLTDHCALLSLSLCEYRDLF
jgi:hypothetical protein